MILNYSTLAPPFPQTLYLLIRPCLTRFQCYFSDPVSPSLSLEAPLCPYFASRSTPVEHLPTWLPLGNHHRFPGRPPGQFLLQESTYHSTPGTKQLSIKLLYPVSPACRPISVFFIEKYHSILWPFFPISNMTLNPIFKTSPPRDIPSSTTSRGGPNFGTSSQLLHYGATTRTFSSAIFQKYHCQASGPDYTNINIVIEMES